MPSLSIYRWQKWVHWWLNLSMRLIFLKIITYDSARWCGGYKRVQITLSKIMKYAEGSHPVSNLVIRFKDCQQYEDCHSHQEQFLYWLPNCNIRAFRIIMNTLFNGTRLVPVSGLCHIENLQKLQLKIIIELSLK